MRDLRRNGETEHTFIRNTLRWQDFLQNPPYAYQNKRTPLYAGRLTGLFDAETEAATRLFQEQQRDDENKIVANGVLDRATRDRAAALGFDIEFEQGPDHPDDLRECRPYFLVPLLEVTGSDGRPIPRANREGTRNVLDDMPDDFHDICNRIEKAIAGQQSNPEDDPEITDVYVFSHGWHRNFFSGVQAYDRLASYIALLRHRNRLDLPEKYRPLYLMLHWNSDPGADRWVDKAGRRRKASFMQNVNTVFQYQTPKTYTDMTNDFEDIFEVFSRTSAPDTYSLSDATIDGEVVTLTECLKDYTLKFCTDAPLEEKVSIAWTCYHEAETVGVQLDQDEKPHQFIALRQAVATFVRFVGSAVAAFGLLGAVMSAIAWVFRLNAPLLDKTAHFLKPLRDALFDDRFAILLLLFPACWLYLTLRCLKRKQDEKTNAPTSKSFPLPAALAWLYMQVWMTILPACFLTITYFFGRTFAWMSRIVTGRTGSRDDGAVPGLFDERFGPRNKADTKHRPLYFRRVLAWLVETPLRLLHDGTAPDSAVKTLTELALSQTAFFTMQSKARDAGLDAARFLATLAARTPALGHARIHLIGHSFGALVVANAARHLALDAELRKRFRTHNPEKKLYTVCMVQGALASNWFKRESDLRAFVEGSITCLYSRYDTANGFYYPVANGGRLAAGYVGLTVVGGTPTQKGAYPERLTRLISLPKPPNLDDPQFVPDGQSVKDRRTSESPRVFNIDVSRLVFRGPILLGGGHDDIFKDDLVNLIWSVTKVGLNTARPPKSVSANAAPPAPAALENGAEITAVVREIQPTPPTPARTEGETPPTPVFGSDGAHETGIHTPSQDKS